MVFEMLIKIAIVEDQTGDACFVEKLIHAWADRRGVSVNIHFFPSAEQFLFSYAVEKGWDILLLDIEMGAMDGVSLGKKIRQNNETVQIVFTTGFAEYISEGYEVSALHYLMKPVKQEKLFAVMDRAVAAMHKAERAILLPVNGEMLRLPIGTVQYVEAFAHTVSVVTSEETIQVKISISEMEKMLGDHFVRCHRSYLVGLKYISRISKTDVVLDTGKTLPLSRNAAPIVHKAFVSYYTGDKDENI